jgi:hypothetical protein
MTVGDCGWAAFRLQGVKRGRHESSKRLIHSQANRKLDRAIKEYPGQEEMFQALLCPSLLMGNRHRFEHLKRFEVVENGTR